MQIVLRDPILEKQNKTKQNKTPKGAGEVTQDVGPEFKPQYRKKEKTESVVA
jgi:hypothetical protein